VRHGKGVQLYLSGDNEAMSKYEGGWEKDKMHGEGLMVFPDKSIYIGSYVKGMREGKGKYAWGTGEEYEGQWKKNRIEGIGKFVTNPAPPGKPRTFVGHFKNNYFKYSDTTYINPLLPEEDFSAFLKHKYKLDKKNEEGDVKHKKEIRRVKTKESQFYGSRWKTMRFF
jgi:hypothetical protein